MSKSVYQIALTKSARRAFREDRGPSLQQIVASVLNNVNIHLWKTGFGGTASLNELEYNTLKNASDKIVVSEDCKASLF